MITINNFNISTDGKNLNVSVSASATYKIISVKLWNQSTYKDYTQAVDFTSKLAGTSENEIFTINASEVGETDLEGIYWIEFETDELGISPELGVATNLTRFYYCISEMLCAIQDPCVPNNVPLFNVLTSNLYIDSLRNSLILTHYTQAIMFWKNLNRLCKVSCKTCCDVSSVTQAGLGFATINNELILQ